MEKCIWPINMWHVRNIENHAWFVSGRFSMEFRRLLLMEWKAYICDVLMQVTEAPVLGPFLMAFPGTLARSWKGREAPRISTDALTDVSFTSGGLAHLQHNTATPILILAANDGLSTRLYKRPRQILWLLPLGSQLWLGPWAARLSQFSESPLKFK